CYPCGNALCIIDELARLARRRLCRGLIANRASRLAHQLLFKIRARGCDCLERLRRFFKHPCAQIVYADTDCGLLESGHEFPRGATPFMNRTDSQPVTQHRKRTIQKIRGQKYGAKKIRGDNTSGEAILQGPWRVILETMSCQ